jgi:hypothetical protein
MRFGAHTHLHTLQPCLTSIYMCFRYCKSAQMIVRTTRLVVIGTWQQHVTLGRLQTSNRLHKSPHTILKYIHTNWCSVARVWCSKISFHKKLGFHIFWRSYQHFGFEYSNLWWIHSTFRNRGTAYNSRSFAGNLLFVGDYGSWCSGTTIFTVSSIMLMWNLVTFWFPWQLLRFLRFSIVIPS